MDKAATKALAQRVASLEKTVHRLVNTPREHDQESTQQRHDTEHEGVDAPRATAIISPTPSNAKKPNDSWHSSTRWWKRAFQAVGKVRWYTILQTIGIIAGILYAAVTYFQWRDLRHNFQVDQRAWIKAKIVWTDFPATEQVVITLANIGKSVAVSPHAVAIMEVVEAKSEPSLIWKFKPHQNAESSLDFPGDVEDPLPLPFYATDMTPRKLSDVEKQSLTAGKSYVVASGLVAYSDQFGKHWTRFCSWQSFSKEPTIFSARKCVQWNAVGDGDPPE